MIGSSRSGSTTRSSATFLDPRAWPDAKEIEKLRVTYGWEVREAPEWAPLDTQWVHSASTETRALANAQKHEEKWRAGRDSNPRPSGSKPIRGPRNASGIARRALSEPYGAAVGVPEGTPRAPSGPRRADPPRAAWTGWAPRLRLRPRDDRELQGAAPRASRETCDRSQPRASRQRQACSASYRWAESMARVPGRVRLMALFRRRRGVQSSRTPQRHRAGVQPTRHSVLGRSSVGPTSLY
jgi:hypothetical protein